MSSEGYPRPDPDVALIPCEGECVGATKHFYSRPIEIESKSKAKRTYDLFFKCYCCGEERQYGCVEVNLQ